MTNANELRIGNYIYWNIPEKINTFHEVVGIRNGKPQTIPISLGESISDYLPIPLTPEILEKCGFEKDPFEMSGCEVWNFPNTFWRVARSYRNENEYKLWGKLVSPPTWNLKTFAYLHELQNIIFALTNEELTFKP